MHILIVIQPCVPLCGTVVGLKIRSCVLVSKQHLVMTLVDLLFLFHLQKSAILTTVGVLEQPLGNARLHVARLVAALLQTNAPSICQELCNLATMDLLLVG